jgi:uncharacterized damage-inducible protein DinB
MALNESMLEEFKQEVVLTKKMLERVPFLDPVWKPHEKSMTIQRLSSHIAEIPVWMLRTLGNDGFDFSTIANQERFHAKDNNELLQKFEEMHTRASDALQHATDEQLTGNWSARRGEQIIFNMPRIVAIRKWVFNHTIHHRGQLSVYLRLNNVAVPGMYGPSADER